MIPTPQHHSDAYSREDQHSYYWPSGSNRHYNTGNGCIPNVGGVGFENGERQQHQHQKHQQHQHQHQHEHRRLAPPRRSLLSQIRRFDLFPKVDVDHRQNGTFLGGSVSLLGAILCAILSISEVQTYVSSSGAEVEHLTVHRRLDGSTYLSVRMDVDFVRTKCDDIVLDAIDIGGDSVALGPKDGLRKVPTTSSATRGRSGAGGEGYGEGCRLTGEVTVNRVGGLFHFHSASDNVEYGSFDEDGSDPESHPPSAPMPIPELSFDPSHVWKDLRFWPLRKEEGQEKKDGSSRHWNEAFYASRSKSGGCFSGAVERNVRHGGNADGGGVGTGLFKYYAQLVPTTHYGTESRNDNIIGPETGGPMPVDSIGCVVLENFEPYRHLQLDADIESVDTNTNEGGNLKSMETNADDTESTTTAKSGNTNNHHAHRTIPEETVLPGVLVQYELFPFSMEISKTKNVPLMHLLIRLSAVVGGVFTIMGWLNDYLCRLVRKTDGASSRRQRRQQC